MIKIMIEITDTDGATFRVSYDAKRALELYELDQRKSIENNPNIFKKTSTTGATKFQDY